MYWAIDREEIMQAITWGFGAVANQIWTQDSFWRMPFPAPKVDPEKAKALLTEAGYPDGLDVTIECKPAFLPVTEVVQDQLKRGRYPGQNRRARLGLAQTQNDQIRI